METIDQVNQFHSTSFSDIPPFPDDVPTAPLLRISLQKLLENGPGESERLFMACKQLGFFYLDLRGTPEGESIIQDADQILSVGSDVFDLSLEEKENYDFSDQKSYFGYAIFLQKPRTAVLSRPAIKATGKQ